MKPFALIENNLKNFFSLIGRNQFHSSTMRRAKAGNLLKLRRLAL